MKSGTRIALVQDSLKKAKVDFFLLPRADRFQGEYVAPSDERLAWLTGFTGSAGMCIIGLEETLLFVDGRYTLQAKAQINNNLIRVKHLPETPPVDWLRGHLQPGQILGIDTWYFTHNQVEELSDVCLKAEAHLQVLSENLIDALWLERPDEPNSEIVLHGIEYSGLGCSEKLDRLRRHMVDEVIDAKMITDPYCVAWLFNIRAKDLEFTPVALAYALITQKTAILFIKKTRFGTAALNSFPDDVRFEDVERLPEIFNPFFGKKISVDPATVPEKIFQMINVAGGELELKAEPISLWKACKNDIEIQGMRNAHVRDGVAICRFIHWLKTCEIAGFVDERNAARMLETFREDLDKYTGPSYYPISATGPNSAICHYQPAEENSKMLENGDIFLIDSGGQYLDGTTDFTRVFPVGGTPSPEQKFHYTLVLKAHISLASIKFPAGTTGRSLDAIARIPLWQKGLDYDHGTGHGVGCYLSVHEGPQRIAKTGSDIPLAPGMVLSIEPGYYSEGKYGIRFENLVEVVMDDADDNEGLYLKFEPLTLVPIEMSMVIERLLDRREMNWINKYNSQVLLKLSPFLESEVVEYFNSELKEI